MQKLIKNGEFAPNEWNVLQEIQAETSLDEGKYIIPFKDWLEKKDSLTAEVGVWFNSDDSVENLSAADIAEIPVIAINFPVFADGRGFSLARQINEQLEFKGELRAIGNFIQDQMFYLKRCGINAFQVSEEADIESIRVSLNDFSNSYQAASDEPRPLFRRRS